MPVRRIKVYRYECECRLCNRAWISKLDRAPRWCMHCRNPLDKPQRQRRPYKKILKQATKHAQ